MYKTAHITRFCGLCALSNANGLEASFHWKKGAANKYWYRLMNATLVSGSLLEFRGC